MSLLDWAMRNTWAMDPSYINKMFGVLARHTFAEKLTSDEIAKVTGKPSASLFDRSDDDDPPPFTLKNGVATVRCYGVICKRAASVNNISGPSGTSTEQIRANIQAALDEPKAKSIVLDVDSPGGSVDGVADLSDFIFNSRGKKPITAFANGQMASAAYYIASAADRIVTSQDAAVGSIGVYSILQDASMYLKNMGISEEMIKAGKYKGLGHPDFPITADLRKVAQAEVDAHYKNFVGAVARNRGMSVADATKCADGRCHIGQEAVDMKLADSIGTLDDLSSGGASGSNVHDSPKKVKPITAAALPAPAVIQAPRRNNFAAVCETADRILAVRFAEKDSRPGCRREKGEIQCVRFS